MKCMILVKNPEEKVLIRSFLKEIPEIMCHGKTDDFTDDLIQAHSADLIILDERIGDLIPILEKITALAFKNQPLIQILLCERGGPEEGWAAECDRIDRYQELGAELFVYRPYGLDQIKEKILEAVSWAHSTPAWVKLARAGRSLVRSKEYDRILKGLEALHSLMPSDSNVTLLYARSLIHSSQSQQLNYPKAISILKALDAMNPKSVLSKKLLIQAYEARGEHLYAFQESLKLLPLVKDIEFYKKVWSSAKALALVPGFDKACVGEILSTFEGMDAPKQTQECRFEIVQKMMNQVNSLDSADVATDYLQRNLDLNSKLRQTTERLLAWVKKEIEAKGESKQSDVLVDSLMSHILDIQPVSWALLLEYVDNCIHRNMLSRASLKLKNIKATAPSVPIQYYVAMARVALAKKEIGEAQRFVRVAEALPNESAKKELLEPLKSKISEITSSGFIG